MSGPSERRPVVVTPCADGPILVRGADQVQDATGAVHEVTRPVVAVCTCERSQRLPWCDGTHRALNRGRRRGPSAAPRPGGSETEGRLGRAQSLRRDGQG